MSRDEQKELVHFSPSLNPFFLAYAWCLFSDIFCRVRMTSRFNKAMYVELKQKESEEAQPGRSL